MQAYGKVSRIKTALSKSLELTPKEFKNAGIIKVDVL